MAYVERNPVRARMVRKAWRYPWSSALTHTGEAAVIDPADHELVLSRLYFYPQISDKVISHINAD